MVPPADAFDRFAARVADRFGVATVRRTAQTRDLAGLPDDAVAVLELGGDADEDLASCATDLQRLSTTIVVSPARHPADGSPPAGAGPGVTPVFDGGWSLGRRHGRLRVFSSERLPRPGPAPASFSVAAVMCAYNEADIIRPSVQRLIDQGIEVHLIDNWSTDGTGELVEDLVGHGLLAIERFPPGGRTDRYEWEALLIRSAEVAAGLRHDWCVHHDVDQRRDSPWPELTYRDGLWTAQQWGFDAVDHTLVEFRPVDDCFVPGTEVSEHLRFFEFPSNARFLTHVQAWRNRQPVDLVGSGGHDATFPGRRVFPFNFVLRHYPIRSQTHGERKVFTDRAPRYRPEELRRGWHYHYARLRPGHRFVKDPARLAEYRPGEFERDHLLAIIACNGFPEPRLGPVERTVAAATRVLGRTSAGKAWSRRRQRAAER